MSEEIINPAVENAEEIEEQVVVKPATKKSNASVDNDKFDWDAFENDGFDAAEKAANEESYSKSLSRINENEVVEGTVTSINKREVIVNIGYKSEGVISINEFRYNPDLAVGDTVEVYVENAEDKKGQLILSHKRARAVKSWDRVNEAFEKDEIVKGYIKCRTKGGMIVDVFGIEAFLPGSQIDVKPIRDYDVYVNKTMEFKIVKINQEFRNVVVSHKALIEAEIEAQKADIIAKLEKGQVLEGTVKNITSYGVFVDLGGVDGLIHITDLSWGRIKHPSEVVKPNQEVDVKVLSLDPERERIQLGYKQLQPHPWDNAIEKYPEGAIVDGKVVRITDFGAFVELEPGLDGLVHISQCATTRVAKVEDAVKVGEEVKVKVLGVDPEKKRISLSIRQVLEPEAPAAEEEAAAAPEAEYEVVATDDKVAEQFVEAVEAVTEAAAEEAAEEAKE